MCQSCIAIAINELAWNPTNFCGEVFTTQLCSFYGNICGRQLASQMINCLQVAMKNKCKDNMSLNQMLELRFPVCINTE